MAILGDKAVGDIVKIKEDGVDVEYIIIHKGKPSNLYDNSCNGVWVLRKSSFGGQGWDKKGDYGENDYENSFINNWLNTDFFNTIEDGISAIIKTVKIPFKKGLGNSSSGVYGGTNGLSCKIFLLSGYETGFSVSDNEFLPVDGAKLSYFYNSEDVNNYGESWWVRSPTTNSDCNVFRVNTYRLSKEIDYYCAKVVTRIRPAFILPTTLTVNSDGTLTTITNSPPTISSSTSSGSSLGGVAAPFNFTYTVNDVDNDTVTASEYLDNVLQRSYSVSLGVTNTFQAVSDTDSFQNISNGSHTLKVVATDSAGASSSAYIVTFDKQVNTAPTITSTTSSGSNLGEVASPFDFIYIVNDIDRNTVTVKEYLDDVLQRSYAATLGVSNTFQTTSTIDGFQKISNGSHTIKVVATDSKSTNSTPYTVTFNKQVNTVPTISSTTSSGSNLGEKTEPFDFTYTVNDVNGDTVTVKEYLDDVLQREYAVVLGADNPFQAVSTNENFEKIANGSHTIKIIATDDEGENSAPYTVTFEKKTVTPPVDNPDNPDNSDNSQVIPDCGSFTSRMKGIDVSHWQGDIGYKQVKNSGIDFVIIKAGEWDHTDEKFEQNYENAKAAGLHIGFYWFCDGKTLSEINMEADACIKVLEGKQFDFPVYIDLENSYQYDLGEKFCSDAVRLFCNSLEKAGYFAGLYTSTSWLDNVIDDEVKKRYTLWVADWRGYCGYDGDYSVWQYGAGYVPGINGKTESNILEYGIETDYPGSVIADGVDLDYAYEDFPCIITSKGFNNYPTPETKWENDDCKTIANTLSISGAEAALSGDRWILVDKSCSFTLETLPYAKIKIYVVGGGCDGAEWEIDPTNPKIEAYRVPLGCRGGSVLVKELTLMGNVECQTFIADVNNPTSTAVRIGDDIYKCDDKGSIWRKATASSNAEPNYRGGVFNSENGANGVKTPYGYVGSSGGGGGAYSVINRQYVTVYAGKGGSGAGNGGELKKDGDDAQNYGCGGGSAGFFGFYSDGDVVETHAGHGRGGCVIFEILDSGECDDSPNNPNKDNSACGCGCDCNRLEDIFTCPEHSTSTETCTKETNYTLTYDGDTPVETETTTSMPSVVSDSSQTDSNAEAPLVSTNSNNSNSSCGCNKSGASHSSGGCGCCGSGNGGNGCVSYDVARWGENWLLFDESGEYTLNFDIAVKLTAYIVGGGSDGKDGLYYNKTAYGGDGGMGGYVNIVSDIEVKAGDCEIDVIIGDRGGYGLTSVIIDNKEYCCNGAGWTVAEHGNQGVCGKTVYHDAGNGANGIETPFGWVGSSGGGGAAYYNGNPTSRGRGGLYAGNGGKIVNGKSTKGEKAIGFGCGGGGGAASSTSWCKGGRGKHGCVILRIQ